MRKTIFLLFLWSKVFAQTGIGTTTPAASAKLEVYSTNKGFLPPRVSLTGVYDATTILTPATGLLVYCTGSGGLSSGYYFWNGTAWATIATEGGSGSVAAEFGSQMSPSASIAITSATPADVLSFTLPSAGTWEVISFVRSQGAAGYAAEYALYDPSGNLVPNSEILPAYGQLASTGTGVIRITTTGAATYKLKAWASTAPTYNYAVVSDGNGRTGVTWQKISGNAPVTGQSVDYGIARYSGADGGALGGGALISFDATAAGNLAWSGNKFTLKANKTYELESSLAIYQTGGGVGGRFQIYDYTNSVALANGLFMSQNGSATNSPSANGPMKGIVTPVTDIQVGVRLMDWFGPAGPGIVGSTSASGGQTSPNASYFIVKQIGSSAIVNPWTLAGTTTYNTLGKVGIGNTSPNATLDIRTSPTSTTDPGAGYIGIGTTSVAASTAGVGALRYNTANSLIEFSNGSTWLSLSPGNSPMYAQFSSNAGQYFNAIGTKMLFQVTNINVGSMSNASNGTIYLPAGRIYRVDLNLGWANVGWSRFAIFNASTSTQLSQTAHIEAGSGNWAGTGTTTCFINTSSGAINIEARFVAPLNSNSLFGDTANGGNYPSLTIQTVD